MIFYCQIGYILFCIAFAYWNAWRIKRDLEIYHDLNFVIHLFLCALGMFLSGWRILLVMPLEGKAIFDAALNYFRKLPQDYVTTWGNPSKLDRAELWLFGSPLAARIVYLSFVVALNLHFIYEAIKQSV